MKAECNHFVSESLGNESFSHNMYLARASVGTFILATFAVVSTKQLNICGVVRYGSLTAYSPYAFLAIREA
jgi:hypothetical protein